MILPFFLSAQRARWYSFRTPDILQRRYRFSPLQDLSPSPRPCMQQRSLPPFLFHYFHFHTTSASLFVHTQYFLPNAEKKEERGSPTPTFLSPRTLFPSFSFRQEILFCCHVTPKKKLDGKKGGDVWRRRLLPFSPLLQLPVVGH